MTVCTAIAVAVLLFLGFWQLERLQWKQNLLDDIATSQAAEPTSLPVAYSEQSRFRRVKVTGRYIPGKQDYLFGRTFKGATGYLFLAPFVTDSGRTVLVNRGWVSEKNRDPKSWKTPDKDETLTLIGSLRAGVKARGGAFAVWNDPDADALVFIEPPLIAKRLNLPDLEPFYLDLLSPENSGGYPVILADKLDIPNNHLQYALTWFAFAFILLVIFVLRSVRTKET